MIRITASQLRRLKETGHRFDFVETAEALHLDARDSEGRLAFQEPVETVVTVEVFEDQYYVKFHAKAKARFVCDRCLAEVPLDVEAGFGIVFMQPGAAGSDDDVLGTDDFRLLKKDEDIVLDDSVREALLLEIPNKILCSEACKGICPRCGSDLNKKTCGCAADQVDPRWEKLAEIRKQLED